MAHIQSTKADGPHSGSSIVATTSGGPTATGDNSHTPDAARVARKDLRPRHRLGAATRTDEILAAAAGLFARLPYALVSVADIARAADASEALVYRYFATKAELYAQVVARGAEKLALAERAAIMALHPNTPVKAKLRAALGVYLDHVASHSATWVAATGEPPEAVTTRTAARQHHVDALAGLLTPNPSARHRYALWGYLGFVDAVCLEWVRSECRTSDRNPIIESALGALEGALGDWAA